MVRHFLRQNPHVIVVGETRDSATALQLLQAIESGHLSLTSLHSVTCGEGWARLINLLPEEVRASGVRTLGSNLTAIINNRLGRRVCQNCAKPIAVERAGDHIDPSYLAALDCAAGTEVLIASEAGCEICHHTSHIGRTLVTESMVMPIDHAHREAVVEQLNRGSSSALRQTLGDHYQSRQHVAANLLLQRVIDVREYGTLCQA
jgi:type II secretory ATPase GspE/PulE/Tfp pilus assembly ATPase PilB-like protein